MMYDIVSDGNYTDRLSDMRSYAFETPVVLAPTRYIHRAPFSHKNELHKARNLGYEGLMIRDTVTGYEDGKRSKSLVKIKKFSDDEFEVVDIVSSKDGWGILECITEGGVLFRVSAPGTIREKERVLQRKSSFIGESITVEYSDITKDGVPLHPVAIAFRSCSD